ncbi:MAG: hypothetical protein J4G09_02835 [Proteobacteria bacterium]|nr:hypothetical protein [Pseudomonadota bacterium]
MKEWTMGTGNETIEKSIATGWLVALVFAALVVAGPVSVMAGASSEKAPSHEMDMHEGEEAAPAEEGEAEIEAEGDGEAEGDDGGEGEAEGDDDEAAPES